MSLVNQISYYLNLIFGILFFILIILAGSLFYFLKIKKVTAKVEHIDYSAFRREDSLEYVKFESIESETADSLNTPGMISVGGNVFVAGLSVSGYSFATASSSQKENTMLSAITFFNSVDEPIQFRQTAQAIDLTDNIQIHERILSTLNMEGMELEVEYEETLRMAEDYIDSDDYERYVKRLQTLQKQITAKKHSVAETKALIEYMNALSVRGNSGTQKVHQLMFSWTYNPDEMIGQLSETEIRMQAFLELQTIGKKYMQAFSECGYTAKRLSAEDITLLMYKQMHPLSSDEVRMEDIFNSSYNSLFITSDSLIDLEKKRIGEEEFERKMEEYQNMQDELLYQQSLLAEKQRQEMYDETHEQAVIQMSEG